MTTMTHEPLEKLAAHDELELQEGSMVMLHPNTYTDAGIRHPNRGQVGQVIRFEHDMVVVLLSVRLVGSDERGLFLKLPSEVFLRLPIEYTERVAHDTNADAWAYRLSNLGISEIQAAKQHWMVTECGMAPWLAQTPVGSCGAH